MEPGRGRRGRLSVHLGVARGAGATWAMVDEAVRRAGAGEQVRVGHLAVAGRPDLARHAAALPHSGGPSHGVDVVVLDDLSGDDGGRPRWETAEAHLAAGTDVVGSMCVDDVASLADAVDDVTGTPGAATPVPDSWVRRADRLHLVDVSPEDLRERLDAGALVDADHLGAGASEYYRTDRLAARRELALRWVADQVGRPAGAAAPRPGRPADTHERVLVALTGAPGNDRVLRRAARLAERLHGDLVGVHVRGDGRPARADLEALAALRAEVEDLGGTFVETTGNDVADVLVAVARAERATQMVVGASRRTRLQELGGGSVVGRLVRTGPGLDVHVVAESAATPDGAGRHRPPRRRAWRGWATLAVGLPLVVALLVAARDELGVPSSLLLMLLVTVVTAAAGGLVPGLVAAVAGVLAVNWFAVPPYQELSVDATQDAVALVVFVAVGVVVATLVDRLARRSAEADRARSDTAVLARTATALATEADPLPTLIGEVRHALGLRRAAVEMRRADGSWTTLVEDVEPGAVLDGGAAGGAGPSNRTPLGDGPHSLVLEGAPLDAPGLELLDPLLDELVVALDAADLQRAAARAEVLEEVEALRSGILQAVSHDLRTPLAGIKASVTSLIADDVEFGPEDTRTFLRTIDDEVDRLDRVVGNLLDMGRLQAGALGATLRPTALEDVVTAALRAAGAAERATEVRVPPTLPLVSVDAALVETALANVVANALVVQPAGRPVVVQADLVADEVVLQVVDHGPGIPAARRADAVVPFQRLGDRSSRAGVGLGLAIADGFVRATGGTLELGGTPGGGLTVTFRLPVDVGDAAGEDAREAAG